MPKFNVPYCDNFLAMANSVGQTEAMEYVLRFQEQHFQGKVLRNLALFDVGQHAREKRFYLFDGFTKTFKQYHAAHGSGSEGDSNDGYATIFSNTPNSRCTSLGVYKCGGEYLGGHGNSMYLDGLESTNSKARDRSIVMHGASYVREVEGAEAGDSWGCPALADNVVQGVIKALTGGSLLYIFVRKSNTQGQTTVNLKRGSEGSDVSELQSLLGIKSDGNFGPVTEAAVKSFQSANGLVVDGIVGSKTWEKLHSLPVPVSSSNQVIEKRLWYPKAVKSNISMSAKGLYAKGWPRGAVVHFTAGNYLKGLQSAQDTISWGKEQGYNFLCIATTGEIVQASPLNKWGYHAGVSSWKIDGKQTSSVSEYLVGIEMNNPGKLTEKNGKYYTWYDTGFKSPLDKSTLRIFNKKRDNIQPGAYLPYDNRQVVSLIEFLLFLKHEAPDVFSFDYVVGHDEVAPTRKNDPGGALPYTMPEFRELLKTEYKKRYG